MPYRHDPYGFVALLLPEELETRSIAETEQSIGTGSASGASGSQSTATGSKGSRSGRLRAPYLPYGTLHRSLRGRVRFVPYPAQAFEITSTQSALSAAHSVRVFIGQLPYQVTDMQLNWLCYTFGRGATVRNPERIMKHDAAKNAKLPTGCVHAYCHPDDAESLIAGLHKKVLVDDTGVWCASADDEQRTLTEYCEAMKQDRSLRFHTRPYDTVVAQVATSSYRGGR